jgi:acyl-homoserine lactone acylase PvdQ
MSSISGAIAAVSVACVLAVASPAQAAAPVAPYGTNDAGGFSSIIPPGEGTNTTAALAVPFEANGTRPTYDDNQKDMYTNLLYATPGLQAGDVSKYFHDATFGVKPADVASTESPRADVTIVRDTQFGIPHIYGSTRSGAEFGAGWAAAEDRMFFMDVLRHYGSATLSSFAGGANRTTDESQFAAAPYSQADYQKMYDMLPTLYGAEGAQVHQDLQDYADGINAWISSITLDPTKLPAEYPAINQPQGPAPWSPTDTIAISSLIGAQLGTGGGGELDQAKLLSLAQTRFGPGVGAKVTANLRSANDPEAPLSIVGKSFPYDLAPAHPASGSVALPDAGSLTFSPVATGQSGSAASRSAPSSPFAGLIKFPTTDSNALLVSARLSASGHPLMVAGSQAAYFSPEIYMEQDIHGPGLDARGASLPGASMYVVIGHGRDYAWSATSASQDVVDTYAADLCNADGTPATTASNSYLYHGQCLPMETVSHSISWTPSAADMTAPGSETVQVQRTNYGIVYARGTVGRVPVAFTHLRTTYRHEIDPALGFMEFDNPDLIHNVSDFQHAAMQIGYTFNWLYTDSKDIGMITTGAEPIRAPGVDGTLPVRARPQFEWQGWSPDNNNTSYVPFDQRPQVVNQDMIFSWNTKQAKDFASSEPRTPVWRSQLLEERLRATQAKKGKLVLTDVIDAMAGAATADLRCEKTLPYLLKVIGTPTDPTLANAVSELKAWEAAGCQRIDRTKSGQYANSDAIRIFDAWQHPLEKAFFSPVMGPDLYADFSNGLLAGEDTPNSFGLGNQAHLGSSWEQGPFMFEQKDLRTLLADSATPVKHKANKKKKKKKKKSHRKTKKPATKKATLSAAKKTHAKPKHHKAKPKHHKAKHKAKPTAPAVQGRYAVKFCGAGSLTACRAALLASLGQALTIPLDQLYADPTIKASDCGFMGQQECFDAIRYRALGLESEGMAPWQNRPTQQQVVEIPQQLPR